MPRATSTTIQSLFHVPSRFMRSVQLERDFFDTAALDNYIVTPTMAEAFERITSGLKRGSGRRAWRITGDYGVGKSSFALVLAHLLFDPDAPKTARIAATMGMAAPGPDSCPLWPVLITGARDGIVPVIGRGIAECLGHLKPPKGRPPKAWADLIGQAESVVESGDAIALQLLVQALRDHAQAQQGAGILLVVDELGKLLEHAAQSGGRADVFMLQQLAEIAARSRAQPFLFVGMLHQGFQAYAERLPSIVRHEWDKVASRFDEIVFDQPLAHTAALVAGALGIRRNRLPPVVIDAARKTADATAGMGWLSGATSAARILEAASLYPIHPTLLPPLVRFFARYGQHERSLFGFLLSSEPFGLQAFAEQEAGADVWYGLAEFYDYVKSVFGHRLRGGSYQTHWLRVAATVDTAQDLSPLELRTLKTVAILNLLDSDDLLATDRALLACLSPAAARDGEAALRTLADRGLLFRRGIAGGYRLWPNSSVNLGAAMEAAARALGSFSAVSPHIEPFLDREPLLARQHYIRRGTMRYFEVRYAAHDQLERAASQATSADGTVLIALADTPEDRNTAIVTACQESLAREDVIIGVLEPLIGLAGELHDLKCWQWIADNTPELAHDPYAAGEVSRQLANARRVLGRAVSISSSLREDPGREIAWIYRGAPLPVPRGLSNALSGICNDLFDQAPLVTNELINRNNLSSAAAAARMRLIEGLFNAPEQPLFGIDPDRAPPEKSMYLSVIKKGGLHRQLGDGYTLALPTDDHDPLNLKPALDDIQRFLDAGLGARVAVTEILARLAKPPYGVRAGLAPLLLAITVKARAHELAVYENGTFRSSFGAEDFLRLTKAPGTFELQHCRLEGVRAEVFARLAETFAHPTEVREPQILDVVRPLCRFAAQLPEYTRKAGALESAAAKVRDVLLSATDPSRMLFNDLPLACGLAPFSTAETADLERAKLFVTRLEGAVNDLRAAYPRLLGRFIETVKTILVQDMAGFDRAALARRAARVTLAAKLPRLRSFAFRLRDPGTSDEAWAEALASFLISKPPARWGAEDETRCLEQLAALGELFHRVEVAAFDRGGDRPSLEALRVSLTRADGEDRVQIIENAALDPCLEQHLMTLRKYLPLGKDERLQFLTKLLWEELAVSSIDQETAPVSADAKQRPQRT